MISKINNMFYYMKLSNKILRSVIFKHKPNFSTYNTVNMGSRAYSKLLVSR